MADFKKTRLPNSEWHIGTDGEAWRLYPPGNVPHTFLGVWSKKQAMAIYMASLKQQRFVVRTHPDTKEVFS